MFLEHKVNQLSGLRCMSARADLGALARRARLQGGPRRQSRPPPRHPGPPGMAAPTKAQARLPAVACAVVVLRDAAEVMDGTCLNDNSEYLPNGNTSINVKVVHRQLSEVFVRLVSHVIHIGMVYMLLV